MGFWQFATGGGSGGGTGDVVGPASSTDNAIARFDGATGKLLQNSDVTVSDLAAGAVTITAGKGTAITLKNTNPDAAAGASVAGDAFTLESGDAVASTDTDGAAAGGAVNINAGDAARRNSGNANGGDINLTTGAGIGTGTTGKVVLPSAAGLNWSTDTGLARAAAGVINVTDGSTGGGRVRVADGSLASPAYSFINDTDTGIYGDGGKLRLVIDGNQKLYVDAAEVIVLATAALRTLNTTPALYGFKVSLEANTAGSGTPNVLEAGETMSALTNEGATAKNYHTLPSAVAGYRFTFIVQDADGMRIVANTDDTIRVIDKVTAAAGYIESTTIGSTVTLVSINAVEWYAVAITGVWTDGTFTYDDTSLTTP